MTLLQAFIKKTLSIPTIPFIVFLFICILQVFTETPPMLYKQETPSPDFVKSQQSKRSLIQIELERRSSLLKSNQLHHKNFHALRTQSNDEADNIFPSRNPPEIADMLHSLSLVDAGDFLEVSRNLWTSHKMRPILSYEDVMLSSDEKIVYITNFHRILPIDISNIASPIAIFKSMVKIDDNISNLRFLPDAKAVFYLETEHSVVIKYISNPYCSIQLKSEDRLYSPYEGKTLATFSSDSKSGFFSFGGPDSSGLYYFNLSSSTITRLLNSTSIRPKKALQQSRHGKTLFIASNDEEDDTDCQNSTLTICNISDPVMTSVIVKIQINGTLQSFKLTSDNKWLYILRKTNIDSFIEIFDISMLTNITLIASVTIGKDCANTVLSPDENILFVVDRTQDTSFVVDVLNPKKPKVYTSNLFIKISGMTVSSHLQLGFARSKDYLIIAKFLSNIELKTFQFIPQRLDITTIRMNETVNYISSCSNGKTLTITLKNGIETFHISEGANLVHQDFFPINADIDFSEVSLDGKVGFAATRSDILILDMIKKEVVHRIRLRLPFADPQQIVILPDNQTLLYLDSALRIFNISDLKSTAEPTVLLSNVSSFATNGEVILTEWAQTLSIYKNISSHYRPILLDSTKLDFTYETMTLSADGKVALLSVMECDYFFSLIIMDLSNMTTFKHLSRLSINDIAKLVPAISSDSNTLFLQTSDKVIIFDISNKTSPEFLGIPPLDITQFSLLHSTRGIFPMYVLDDKSQLNIVDVKHKYTMYMQNRSFGLGEITTADLVVLKENEFGNYNCMDQSYKFARVSLYNTSFRFASAESIVKYPLLPDWIIPDIANEVLFLDPLSQKDIGLYNLYSSVSTQLLTSDFKKLVDNPRDLLWDLLTIGYIDSDGYLTDIFDPRRTLILPSRYDQHLELAIRRILIDHYFEMVTPISVHSSLSLSSNSTYIQINSPSQFSIRVTITLFKTEDDNQKATQRCRFLNNHSSIIIPVIKDNSSVLTLEGPLFEVNIALSQIIIDNDTTLSCPGNIQVKDGLNPTFERPINDLLNYFSVNPQPRFNHNFSLQTEIDRSLVLANSYFTIPLNESMFEGKDLQYALHHDPSVDWITLNGLSLSGNPGEPPWYHIWPSKYDFEIEFRNEFKSETCSFTLTVYPSVECIMKLIIQIFTLIGLYIYLPRISNILLRKQYRCPKDFSLKSGEDIAEQGIFPIVYMKKESNESRFIIKELKKIVAKRSGLESVSKAQFAQYFIDRNTQKIDEENLFKLIDETIRKLPNTMNKAEQYIQDNKSRTALINQLVLNQIVRDLLSLKKEKYTKQAYKKIEGNWINLVRNNQTYLWQFSVDQQRLKMELETIGIDFKDFDDNESPQVSYKNGLKRNTNLIIRNNYAGLHQSGLFGQPNLTENLNNRIPFDKVSLNMEVEDKMGTNNKRSQKNLNLNIDLLSRAIVARAFEQHHLNIDRITVFVVVKEKIDKMWCIFAVIWQLFKWNLYPVHLNYGEIGYGLEYKTTHKDENGSTMDNILLFKGIANSNIKGKTIVVQITNKRGRILREIWIYGEK